MVADVTAIHDLVEFRDCYSHLDFQHSINFTGPIIPRMASIDTPSQDGFSRKYVEFQRLPGLLPIVAKVNLSGYFAID